mgnify:CR=1 FL=1
MPILYGVPPSPYVRKAMLAHAYKNIPYELKAIMPGSDDDEFRQASPRGKVPAYKTDDNFAFADSSVIIAYLEKTSKDKPLYPSNASDYAKSLWLEEWADSELIVATSALYYQKVIGPVFFNHTTDLQRVDEILTDLIPNAFDLLETRLTEQEWLVANEFSVADITVGTCLISLLHANYQIDQSRWPKLFSFNERFLALEIVQEQIVIEKSMINQSAS